MNPPDNNMQEQINALTKRLDAFDSFNSIPLTVDKAWQARGFIKTDFFVAGVAAIFGGGDFSLIIPGAKAQSIVLVTPFNLSNPVNAEIIESPIFPGQYQIQASGTASDIFSYVVFLFPNLYFDVRY